MKRLVTFDVYTALVDCEAGLVRAIHAALGGHVDAIALARAWRAKQLEYAQLSNSLHRGRIPFRVITERALDFVLAKAGHEIAMTPRSDLLAAWDELPPWPEADATLQQLARRGYTLALLSNGDEEMLRALARRFKAHFDHILASDHAGWYKPHPAIYRLPRHKLGLEPAQVLHVAGSGNDVLGAKLAGLACAWSNRHGDPMLDPEVRPDHEMRDLSGLLAILP